MGNTVQLKKNGQPVFPVTDVSLVMGLQDAIKLPPVKVTTLPTASAETAGKMYYVGPDANDEYERYITSATNGSYEWIDLGDTSIPLPSIADNLTTDDANTALSAKQGKVLNEELGELEAEVNGNLYTNGKYLNKNIEVVDADWGITDFIPYEPGNDVIWRFGDGGYVPINHTISFYDSTKTYITGGYWSASGTTGEKTVTSAQIQNDCPNAAYIRASFIIGTNASVKVGSVTAWRLKGLVDKVGNGTSVLEDKMEKETIPTVLYEKSYVQPIEFELGNITINNTGWTYSDSYYRVRTPQGFNLHLFPGDIIALTDYTNARFYWGCLDSDGNYTSGGWLTADYTVETEGDYCILVGNLSDETQLTKNALGNLIRVTRNETINARLSDMESKLSQDVDKFGVGIVNGYRKVDNLSGVFIPIYTQNSYFPLEDFQNVIRDTPLYGIRFNVNKAGTLTIVKATGVGTSSCVVTNIKTFTLAETGWQTVLFDSPVILESGEGIGIGINTDTARLAVDSVYGGDNAIMTTYLHISTNDWEIYQQNMLIDILGVPKVPDSVDVQPLKVSTFWGTNPFRFGGPFYAHLFLDKIYQDSEDIIIPSQSLEDVRVSHRLGFNVIEANVHATSDGKYVVIHGASGKFGYEVTDFNGDFTYADTAISSVSLDWIKTNIRYRSDIARYRTTIPTLEEFLMECRVCGMIPFVQATSSAIIAITEGIMGKMNYLAYGATRGITNAPIYQYLSLATKEAILEQARSVGVPYIYGMANFYDFTDDELKDIVESLHKEGFMIGSAYTHEATQQRLIKFGFDMIASQFQVNDFEGNICNLGADATFSDFTLTDASANPDGTVTLGSGKAIAPASAPSSVFLGKASLRIVFTGSLQIIMGGITRIFTNDTKDEIWVSTYVLNSAPTFLIRGTESGATVYDLTFRASKC